MADGAGVLDRAVPPAPADPVAVRMPRVHRHTLSNGLEVLAVELHALPVVDLHLVVRAGAGADPPGLEGLAAFTAEMVDEGTSARSALDLADAFDFLGARLHIEASFDATTFALHVLSPRLPEALALLAEILVDPAFPAAEVRRKREELLAALLREDDEPALVATKALLAAVYGNDGRYGAPLRGTRVTAQRFERDAVAAFHAARYRPAGGAFLIAAGDIEPAAFFALLERTLAGWQGEAASPVPPPAAPLREPSAVLVVDRPGAPQSEIRVGHAGPPRTTPDYFPLIVLNTILGGSFTSRLNLKLREEKGYTYGARSLYVPRRGPGPFIASAAVFTGNTADAVADFLGEMRRVRDEAVPDDELDRARRYLALGLGRRFETSEQIAAQLADLNLYGLGDRYYDRFAAEVGAVDAAAVRAAAERHLHPAHARVVVVGDRARIAGHLAALGAGPVHDFAYEPRARTSPGERDAP